MPLQPHTILDPNGVNPLATWEDLEGAFSIVGVDPDAKLRCVEGTASYPRYGAGGGLLRPSADTTLDQKMVARWLAETTGYTGCLVLRCNTNTMQMYAMIFERKAGPPVTGKVSVFWFNNYLGGSSNRVVINQNDELPAIVTGHEYEIEFQAIGTPTVLTAIVRDLTAGTTLYSWTSPSGRIDAGVQTPGQMGVGIDANKANYTLVTSYINAAIIADPDDVAVGVANQEIAVAGVAVPLLLADFALTGGEGAEIVSVDLVSDELANLVINTGNEPGTLTLTEQTSDLSTQIVVNLLISPDAVLDGVQAGGATISADARPQFGTAPYLVELWRGENADFDATEGEGTKVDTQVVGDDDDVDPVTDTSAPAGIAYYRWVTRDAVGNVAQGLPIGTTIPIDVQPRDTILFGGDSITVGVGAQDVYVRELINVDLNLDTTTSDWANAALSFNSGDAEGEVVIIDGKPSYVKLTNRGSYAAAPTPTITGDGTTVTVRATQVGGGQVSACMDALAMVYGFSNLRAENTAQGGTTTDQWLPFATSGERYFDRMLAHAEAANVALAVIGLGTNDAGDRVATATFKGYARTLIQAILDADIPAVAWLKPISRIVTSTNLAEANALILEYHQALDELESEFPGQFYAICGRAFQYSLAHPEQFLDGVHPYDEMYGPMGALMAQELAPILRSLLPSEATQSAVVEVDGTLTIRRGFAHETGTDTELSVTVAADLSWATDVYLQDPLAYTTAAKEAMPATVEPLIGGAARLTFDISSAVTSTLVRRTAHRWNIVADGTVVATVTVEVV